MKTQWTNYNIKQTIENFSTDTWPRKHTGRVYQITDLKKFYNFPTFFTETKSFVVA